MSVCQHCLPDMVVPEGQGQSGYSTPLKVLYTWGAAAGHPRTPVCHQISPKLPIGRAFTRGGPPTRARQADTGQADTLQHAYRLRKHACATQASVRCGTVQIQWSKHLLLNIVIDLEASPVFTGPCGV